MAIKPASRTLTWNDFAEKDGTTPDKRSTSAIGSVYVAGVRAYPQFVSAKLSITPDDHPLKPSKPYKVKASSVEMTMKLDNAYVAKGFKTAAYLAHEQGHYDIANLIAKQIEEGLKKYVADLTSGTNPDDQMLYSGLDSDWWDAAQDAVWKPLVAKLDELQQKYDDATTNGSDAKGQGDFQQFIKQSTSAAILGKKCGVTVPTDPNKKTP